MVDLEPSQRQTPSSKLTAAHLTEGSEVEVSSNEEGFRGAWYRATVIESPPKTNLKRRKKALIEYKFLLADDGSTPLMELVYPSHVRPLPPDEDDFVFSENDAVEARYNDGWWVGVVRNVLESSRYMVYFDNPPDLIRFDAKDLRICLEWKNGAWVRPEKPEVLIASDIKVQLGSNTREEKQRNDRQLTPRTMTQRKSLRRPTPSKKNSNSLAVFSSNKRMKLIASNGSGVPSPLSKPFSEGNGVIQPLSVQSDLPREISTTGDQSSVPTQSPLARSKRMKQEKSKTSQGKSQDKTSDTSVKCLYDLVKSKRSRGKSQAKTVEACNAEVPAADGQKIEVDRAPFVEGLPLVVGLKASGAGNPQLAGLGNVAGDESKQIDQQKDGSTQRRKRGRPRKLLVIAEAGNESGGVTSNIKTTDHSQVEVTAVTGAGSSDWATEVGTGVTKICNGTVDDDQPLSTWARLQSSSNYICAGPLFAETVTGAGDKHPDVVGVTKNCVNDRIEKLPFLKKCPVWEVTESLEAFKTIPQKPHFFPLAELNEELREGTAIGMMVIFSNFFEKIPKLRIEDPKSVFDSTFESLLDLEKNGFDVTELKRRESELLAIKVAKEQLESELSDTGRMIMKCSGEKKRFEVEMTEIKKKITELQELHEAVQLKKDAEEDEVTRRKSEINSVHERIQDARRSREVDRILRSC